MMLCPHQSVACLTCKFLMGDTKGKLLSDGNPRVKEETVLCAYSWIISLITSHISLSLASVIFVAKRSTKHLTILQGSFRLCNWFSLRRLVWWINHLPAACWSTFWKSIFKHQLGCKFDILDSLYSFFSILTYAILYVLIYHIIFWLYLYLWNIFYIFKYSCTNIFHRSSLCTFYKKRQ